jgi:hypothetical protein
MGLVRGGTGAVSVLPADDLERLVFLFAVHFEGDLAVVGKGYIW